MGEDRRRSTDGAMRSRVLRTVGGTVSPLWSPRIGRLGLDLRIARSF